MADVLMPRLSDTMAEGVLSQWLKKQGDPVRKGDVLAEIETDKATMELEAYDEGVLERLLVPEGATVPIGQLIAVIGDGHHAAAAPAAPPPAVPGPGKPATAPAPGTPAAAATQIRTSPLARKIAHSHGIDLATITGTGPGGRIVRADVEAAAASAEGAPGGCGAAPPPPEPGQAAAAAAADGQADDEEVPLTAVRRITAGRPTRERCRTAFLPDRSHRRRAAARVPCRGQPTGWRPPGRKSPCTRRLAVRACAVTLRGHPQVNSSWAC